ncbi:MAG: hypothetical protein GX162_06480 [Firmicutes bacterium]|jgi:hypothetical protein|nr:hypothetical protein [Bacillota bacterium]
MRDSNRSEEAFGGLIADTMELPKVAPPTKQADDATPKRSRWLVVVLTVVASFLLGLGIRMAINLPFILGRIEERIEEKGSAPSEIITAPVTQGTDISHELGRRIQLPIFVEQVLPFMPQGDAHKYQVLGGYLLDTDGNADRRMPIMVVFERTKLEWEVSPKDFVLIEGLVVMANETERVAATLLTPEQEKDLAYIAQRVNYWDRVTVLGSSARLYDIPAAD